MEETAVIMELVFPTMEYKQAALEYRQEWLDFLDLHGFFFSLLYSGKK